MRPVPNASMVHCGANSAKALYSGLARQPRQHGISTRLWYGHGLHMVANPLVKKPRSAESSKSGRDTEHRSGGVKALSH